jgi:hypothetical protein
MNSDPKPTPRQAWADVLLTVIFAALFGFQFLENCQFPYTAQSIRDFWRRWHISLSTWFRDYVYIPLGGNRVSVARNHFNLVAVFFCAAFGTAPVGPLWSGGSATEASWPWNGRLGAPCSKPGRGRCGIFTRCSLS